MTSSLRPQLSSRIEEPILVSPGSLPTGRGVPLDGYTTFEARPPWRILIGAFVLCVATTLLGAEGAVIAEYLKEEEWEAISQVEFRDPLLLPETVAVTLKSPSIWHPVAVAEGISDEEFQKHYDSSVAGGTQIIDVSFVDPDPERARRITEAVVDRYIEQFSASPIEDQTEVLTAYVNSLRELEASIEASLENRGLLTTAVQVDLQDQLVRSRQRINDVTLRIVQQEDAELERASTDPRMVTSGFVVEEPVTPAPFKALVFGGGAGGMIGLLVTYLAFHRTALPASGQDPWVPRSRPTADGAGGRQSTVGPTSLLALKRSVDLGVVFAVLVVAWPLMLMVGLAVAATSPGPVLFRQERVGRMGRTFTMVKFRTMYVDNDDRGHRAHIERQLNSDLAHAASGGESFKLDDRRVTSVGRVLRRFSLDELPQLWNVARGDMSLVGPRPALVWEHQLFGAAYSDRILAVPGCSGLWQVSGRSNLPTVEMLELDLDYVRNWSFGRDLMILARTPLVLLRGDGAR